MAATVVETWVNELAKLKAKVVRPKNNKLSSSSGQDDAAADQGTEKQVMKKGSNVVMVHRSESDICSTMSEDTVRLIMDRFVPW
ncbi:unnamed protein product [Linum tenue]|uniref:Uncharacterized protein n=1 Tax=Linum tenue TaxID=586396 RepID=A0AAV0MJF4_9ROSI|nr:unnamed protein product [Linum tenue]